MLKVGDYVNIEGISKELFDALVAKAVACGFKDNDIDGYHVNNVYQDNRKILFIDNDGVLNGIDDKITETKNKLTINEWLFSDVPDEVVKLVLTSEGSYYYITDGMMADNIELSTGFHKFHKNSYIADAKVVATRESSVIENKKEYTLTELGKIGGAFDEGKQYVCNTSDNSCYIQGKTYPPNGKGIVDEYDSGTLTSSYSRDGNDKTQLSFSLVADDSQPEEHEWKPKIGETVLTEWGEAKVEFIKGDQFVLSNAHGLGLEKLEDIKPAPQYTEDQLAAYDLFKSIFVDNDFRLDQCIDQENICYTNCLSAIESGWSKNG